MKIEINTNEELSNPDQNVLSALLGVATVTPVVEEAKPTAKAKPAAKAKAKPKPEPEPEADDEEDGDDEEVDLPEADDEDGDEEEDQELTTAAAVAAATKKVSSGGSAAVKQALKVVGARRVSELTKKADIKTFLDEIA